MRTSTQNKSSCKTAAVMGLLGRGPAAERAVAVQETQVRDIEVITSEILDAKRTGGEAILTIGRGLIEAKAMLSHGEWLPWLEERVEISERVAQNFMRIARNYSNPNTLSDLGASKALMLLAVPADARDEFISEPHMVNGEEKAVIDMTSRELDAAIKERDKALKTAEQAKAGQAAAETARERLAQDVAFANQRIEGLSAEVEEHSAKAREAREAAARLEKELAELRSRPVEVAVEADAAAIEAARKEAEAQMKAKLDKAQKAQAEAEKARKAAEDDKAAAQRELERVQAEALAVREQAAKADKRAAVASDVNMALFNELLGQGQEGANKMGGILMKERPKAPDSAKAMEKAMLALSDYIKGVAAQ